MRVGVFFMPESKPNKGFCRYSRMDSNLEIDGFVEARKELEQLMFKNPEMEKKVQALIRKVLFEARRKIGAEARSKMKSDPRDAYKAVKTTVYRRILGGSTSILQKKKAGARGAAPGGNRGRLRRTEDIMSYQGADRGFILRFINQGTDARRTSYMNGHPIQRVKKVPWHTYKSGVVGGRGAIRARNFFASSSKQAMDAAAEHLTQLIDELIKQQFK